MSKFHLLLILFIVVTYRNTFAQQGSNVSVDKDVLGTWEQIGFEINGRSYQVTDEEKRTKIILKKRNRFTKIYSGIEGDITDRDTIRMSRNFLEKEARIFVNGNEIPTKMIKERGTFQVANGNIYLHRKQATDTLNLENSVLSQVEKVTFLRNPVTTKYRRRLPD